MQAVAIERAIIAFAPEILIFNERREKITNCSVVHILNVQKWFGGLLLMIVQVHFASGIDHIHRVNVFNF